MALTSTQITTSGEDIFLCPGTVPTDVQEHAVTCMIFCNTSASDVTLNLYAVPTGLSVATQTQVIKDLSIPAGETFSFDSEKLVLGTGDRVRAVASANSQLSVTVSSMRVS
jgi:hypothetical protein